MYQKLAINLEIPIRAIPVQSVRFTKNGIAYQPQRVKKYKEFIKLSALSQLTKSQFNATPVTDKPLSVYIKYIFKYPSSFSKKKIKELENNSILAYKITRPDITDNLNKGLIDSLTNVIWADDSIIAEINAKKIYGVNDKIIISIYDLNNHN